MDHSRSQGRRRRWQRALAGAITMALALLVIGGAAAFAPFVTQRGHAASAMQPSGAPKAYVGLFKDNAVAVLDTDSRQVLRTIPVPPGPHGLVITPDGAKVFVSSDGASTVSVINTATDEVFDSIEVGTTPHGLSISPDGRTVLVSGFGTDQAETIDTGTDQVTGRVAIPQPHNSAISPDGRHAYVGSQLQGSTALVAVDLTTMTPTATIPLDKTPRAVSFSPDGHWVYFTLAGSDAVQVLDATSNRITGQIPVGVSPHLPTFTPDGQLGLVVAQGPGELDLLDPGSLTERGAINVGSAPHWIATSSDGHTAYVTNENSNDLSIVDLASRQVLATVPVGNAPRKIAVQPGMTMAASGTMPVAGQMAQMSSPPARTASAAFNDHGTADVRGLTEIDVEADDNYFSPTFLRGDPGQTIRLEIENEGSSLHNFSVPDLNVNTNIPPKGKVEIDVTFPQSGASRFFCAFHTAIGMNGALLVGDATP